MSGPDRCGRPGCYRLAAYACQRHDEHPECGWHTVPCRAPDMVDPMKQPDQKRPGPGRPPLSDEEPTVALTVRLNESRAAKLDAYAKKHGLKGRAEAVRRLVDKAKAPDRGRGP